MHLWPPVGQTRRRPRSKTPDGSCPKRFRAWVQLCRPSFQARLGRAEEAAAAKDRWRSGYSEIACKLRLYRAEHEVEARSAPAKRWLFDFSALSHLRTTVRTM